MSSADWVFIVFVLIISSELINQIKKKSKIEEIPSTHVDVIHDLAYDFYGKRLATCSSDRYITVWDLEDSQDKDKSFWQQTCSWDGR